LQEVFEEIRYPGRYDPGKNADPMPRLPQLWRGKGVRAVSDFRRGVGQRKLRRKFFRRPVRFLLRRFVFLVLALILIRQNRNQREIN
jgi:hypothetical protein